MGTSHFFTLRNLKNNPTLANFPFILIFLQEELGHSSAPDSPKSCPLTEGIQLFHSRHEAAGKGRAEAPLPPPAQSCPQDLVLHQQFGSRCFQHAFSLAPRPRGQRGSVQYYAPDHPCLKLPVNHSAPDLAWSGAVGPPGKGRSRRRQARFACSCRTRLQGQQPRAGRVPGAPIFSREASSEYVPKRNLF